MQSISQGSLKLEAHHDKIGNGVASNTKIKFLIDELTFLLDFKEQAENLQQFARPSQQNKCEQQIAKLNRKIKIEEEVLEEEVVGIRRDTALLLIQDKNAFEQQIQKYYEIAANQLDKKQQIIEELVQCGEEAKKINNKVYESRNNSFKYEECRTFIQKNLQARVQVKQKLLKQFQLLQQIKSIKKKQEESQLINCKNNNERFSKYNFIKNHKQLYRFKSSDKVHADINFQSGQFIKEYSPKKIHPLESTCLSHFSSRTVSVLQSQLFEEASAKMKNSNTKLQRKIEAFKLAIKELVHKNIYKMLQNQQNLALDELKARQLIASQVLSNGFNVKLNSCSYLWAKQQINHHHTSQYSKQWDWQSLRKEQTQKSLYTRPRPRSSFKNTSQQIKITFLINQGLKSNSKTNSSSAVFHSF